MKQKGKTISLIIMCLGIATLLPVSVGRMSAQTPQNGGNGYFPPPYNPYPPGILPPNLNSEIARVQREVDGIEAEAVAQWKVTPPPILTGQPPTLQNTGVQSIEILGKLMNFDKNLSVFKNVACAFCHMPYAAFSGPIPSVNLTMIAYPGSYHYRAQKRTAQRYTYAAYFPALQYNYTQQLFFGGNFWDSRATGYILRNPDSEQAQHPPVDPGEMGMPDTACVAYRLSQAVYRPLFEQIFGSGSFDINFPSETEKICSTPEGAFGNNATPVPLSPEDRTRANSIYNHWAESLDAFEHSLSVSPFTSKFDAYLFGSYTLTSDEMAGYKLFNGKGNCNSCHLDGTGTSLSPGQSDTSTDNDFTPLFTCFGSANEGLPLNPRITLFYETKPDGYGYVMNPYGFGYRDLGMGTFLRSGFGAAPNPNDTWTSLAPTADGQFQVSSARNVALAPPQCPTTEAPGPYFQKEFFHNGYIKSLKQLVHFYNTRDTSYAYPVTSGHCPPGTVERVTCWPMKEVLNNLDMTTGQLGLSDQEEDQIVAFLMTLSDGYTTPYPDINTFTGTCMSGGTAATQGNDSLIPTPPLPPCASAICDVPPLPTMPIP